MSISRANSAICQRHGLFFPALNAAGVLSFPFVQRHGISSQLLRSNQRLVLAPLPELASAIFSLADVPAGGSLLAISRLQLRWSEQRQLLLRAVKVWQWRVGTRARKKVRSVVSMYMFFLYFRIIEKTKACTAAS